MKRVLLFMSLACLAMILVAACGKKEEPPQVKKPVTEEKVRKEVKEAIQTAMAYTEQQKEEYQKTINAQLDEMQKKLLELQA
jgi:Na+-transporting methylmalonyl-CoA/oxaloacetate decarboxylase gamma subunit